MPAKDYVLCNIVFEWRYSVAISSLPIVYRSFEYRLWTVAVIKQIVVLLVAKITHTYNMKGKDIQ